MNRALISGITGQDGSYLTELLLDKGVLYLSVGPVRKPAGYRAEATSYKEIGRAGSSVLSGSGLAATSTCTMTMPAANTRTGAISLRSFFTIGPRAYSDHPMRPHPATRDMGHWSGMTTGVIYSKSTNSVRRRWTSVFGRRPWSLRS